MRSKTHCPMSSNAPPKTTCSSARSLQWGHTQSSTKFSAAAHLSFPHRMTSSSPSSTAHGVNGSIIWWTWRTLGMWGRGKAGRRPVCIWIRMAWRPRRIWPREEGGKGWQGDRGEGWGLFVAQWSEEVVKTVRDWDRVTTKRYELKKGEELLKELTNSWAKDERNWWLIYFVIIGKV